LGFEERLSSGRYSLGATYFDTRFDDLIQFDGAVWRMVNVAESRARGVEFFIGLELAGVSARIDYTYTEAVDRRDGVPLLRRPEHKAGLTLARQLTDRLHARARVAYTGEREDMDYEAWPAERVVLADYAVVDLSLAYELTAAVRFQGRVENLFDAEYEEILGYNSAPAAVYLGAALTM
jgi:vitamin B12 transporter